MQIALYRPQIPQNTGNVARSCAVTGTSLRLFAPMGFTIAEPKLKRAGLDYWPLVDVQLVHDEEAWLAQYADRSIFFSSHTKKNYTDIVYQEDSILVFGSETAGLPLEWVDRWPQRFVTIPMRSIEEARCLNLATSVGIGLYEALRQTGFRTIPSDLPARTS